MQTLDAMRTRGTALHVSKLLNKTCGIGLQSNVLNTYRILLWLGMPCQIIIPILLVFPSADVF